MTYEAVIDMNNINPNCFKIPQRPANCTINQWMEMQSTASNNRHAVNM